MVQYTVEERIFILETYLLKRQNYDICARKCRRRFPGATVPSKPCIIKLFRKWHELGSVRDKKKNRRSFDRGKTGRYSAKNVGKS